MLGKNRLILSGAGLMFLLGIVFGILATQIIQADAQTAVQNALSGVTLFLLIGAVCLIGLSLIIFLFVLKASRVKQ